MTAPVYGPALLELNPVISAADVLTALGTVIDPELGIDVVNLGMIYRIDSVGDSVRVELTLTTPGCPLHGSIVEEVRRAVAAVAPMPAKVDVDVQLVWDPPWTPDSMSESAKRALRF